MDATEHKDLGAKYEIKGFPTLKLFKAGSIVDYNGGRTADAIVDYMVKKSGPPVTTLESVADAEAFLAKHPKAAIAFFDDFEGAVATGYVAYANKFDSLPLAYTKSKDVMVRALCVSVMRGPDPWALNNLSNSNGPDSYPHTNNHPTPTLTPKTEQVLGQEGHGAVLHARGDFHHLP